MPSQSQAQEEVPAAIGQVIAQLNAVLLRIDTHLKKLEENQEQWMHGPVTIPSEFGRD